MNWYILSCLTPGFCKSTKNISLRTLLGPPLALCLPRPRAAEASAEEQGMVVVYSIGNTW